MNDIELKSITLDELKKLPEVQNISDVVVTDEYDGPARGTLSVDGVLCVFAWVDDEEMRIYGLFNSGGDAVGWVSERTILEKQRR